MVTLVSRLGRVVATPARRGGGEDSDDDSTTSDTIPSASPGSQIGRSQLARNRKPAHGALSPHGIPSINVDLRNLKKP